MPKKPNPDTLKGKNVSETLRKGAVTPLAGNKDKGSLRRSIPCGCERFRADSAAIPVRKTIGERFRADSTAIPVRNSL